MPSEADQEPILSPAPPELGEEGAQRFLAQIFELWINPEVQRRIDAATVTAPLELLMAQVIFPPDGPPIVRLNDEVRGKALTRIDRAVEAGGDVYMSDLTGLEAFELDEAELDFGHITVLRVGESWFATFNALSQRARALSFLEKADQFREAAAQAHAKGHASVAVDTLFSACELASKAELIVTRQLASKVNHKAVAAKINAWGAMGNIEAAFVELFNKLGQLRFPYRYDAGATQPMPVGNDDLELVAAIITARRRRFESKI